MKKLLKVLLVCTMAFTLAACGGNSGSDGTKEILIGISPDYPPYESLEGKDMVGFDIDMTKELFKIMNDNGGNYVRHILISQIFCDLVQFLTFSF